MDEELIFGPPGCGKTYTLIDIVKEELGRGTPPDKIAFVSFSKKSIEEAKDRISEQTKLSLKDVPWFKTLHSTGYHWLGLNDSNMLTRADFTKLGEELGVIFDGNTARSNSDGVLLQSFNKTHSAGISATLTSKGYATFSPQGRSNLSSFELPIAN